MFSVIFASFLLSHCGWWFCFSGRRKYHIAVAGRGMQMVEFSPREDDLMEVA
jgi:hypothetical protein